MKKFILLFVSLFILGVASYGQTILINTTHSNIRNHGIKYSGDGGITLTFNKKDLNQKELKELVGSVWILDEDYILSGRTCTAIGAPSGPYIKKGKWDIKSVNAVNTCKQGYAIRNIDSKKK